MEITTTTTNRSRGARAAINALATVGFVALLIIGVWLAVYATRYAGEGINRLASSVGLSSLFQKDDEATLNIITATSTFPVAEQHVIMATTTEAVATSTKPAVTPVRPATGGTYTVITTVTTPIAPYGDPDLSVKITDVGYLRTNDTNSFVSSNDVPDGKRGAVKFTVTNAGTNVTGSWKFKAEVPTSPSFTFTSPSQDSLNPNDRVDFVLGFDRGRVGDDRTITISVDTGKNVDESDEGNNSDSARVDIRKR